MLTPILIFVGVDLFIYLPLAIWVIPKDDESTHTPVSTSTPREENSDTFKVAHKGLHYPIH